MNGERRFPIQARYGSTEPHDVAWSDAEVAYAAYHRLHPGQTLERLAQRGGFGWIEFLALTDVAVFMRANPMTASRALHRRLDESLIAHTRMQVAKRNPSVLADAVAERG